MFNAKKISFGNSPEEESHLTQSALKLTGVCPSAVVGNLERSEEKMEKLWPSENYRGIVREFRRPSRSRFE